MTVSCEPLPEITTDSLTMGELYSKYIDLSIQYTNCATKDDKLIKIMKEN